jgi:hypothetical protein
MSIFVRSQVIQTELQVTTALQGSTNVVSLYVLIMAVSAVLWGREILFVGVTAVCLLDVDVGRYFCVW